jgi:hypothetical protein
MSWDKKKLGKRYYYRSVREGSQTRKVYLGRSLPAQIAGYWIDLQRANRKAQAEAWRAAVACWDTIDDFREQLLAGVQLLTSATLLTAGFHRQGRHKWRRKQHG